MKTEDAEHEPLIHRDYNEEMVDLGIEMSMVHRWAFRSQEDTRDDKCHDPFTRQVHMVGSTFTGRDVLSKRFLDHQALITDRTIDRSFQAFPTGSSVSYSRLSHGQYFLLYSPCPSLSLSRSHSALENPWTFLQPNSSCAASSHLVSSRLLLRLLLRSRGSAVFAFFQVPREARLRSIGVVVMKCTLAALRLGDVFAPDPCSGWN